MKQCELNNCDSKHYAKGLCRKHYRHITEGGHDKPLEILSKCKKCNVDIPAKAGSSGLCKIHYLEKWKDETSWDNKAYKKQYVIDNKDKIRNQISNWHKKNRDKVNNYYHNKRKDPNYRIAHNMRSRLYDALDGRVKHKSTEKLVGCTFEQLKIYLEDQFDEHMSWENYGKYWCIDHIIPLIAYNLEDPEQLEKASHYSNLRPLPVKINYSKASEDKKWKKEN